MESTTTLLAILLLATYAPFALAERTGLNSTGTGRAGHESAQAIPQHTLNANDDQLVAFAKCQETTDVVRKIADEMGTRWRYDAKGFPEQEADLKAAVAGMTTAHQRFRRMLSSDQEERLTRHLSKLEQLQADLSSLIWSLDQELSLAKPDWRHLYSDAHKIKEAAERWRSEHRKIAKEMSISG